MIDIKHNHYNLVLSPPNEFGTFYNKEKSSIVLMSKLKTPTEHQQLHQDTDLSHADQPLVHSGAALIQAICT